ncbi:PRC-barrel domain-containing protein [Microvirga arabica]|uniref:PRC-barrel domain-containing protein n=1 Tax=Microvirga arabica TaxID=1128671 RepID=UPI001939931D|nr:PRC-barrel domain-containing protein [Microvirga arabica]MBM1170040.1 PRC-barrel domain-containing protein [Microvirga arabica]
MRLIIMAVLASAAIVPTAAMAQRGGGPSQPVQANQASQTGGVAVSDLEGREVYRAQGQAIGQVDGVVLGQNGQSFAVVSFDELLDLGGEARLVPLARMTLQGGRAVIPDMSDKELRSLQTYRANIASFRVANPGQQVTLSAETQPKQQQVMHEQSSQAGSQIVVKQAAPTVRVDPADPRVVVRQPQPQVTVNQAQPEIIVRQPQPMVTVNIPQPEIVLRMPQPDVNVAMQRPHVRVLMERPDVAVVPQSRPQVQVDAVQPQVLVQRQAAEPQVQVRQAQGQPTLRYERAEPRVIINRAPGQPSVRIERPDQYQPASAQGQANREQGQVAQQQAQQHGQQPKPQLNNQSQ